MPHAPTLDTPAIARPRPNAARALSPTIAPMVTIAALLALAGCASAPAPSDTRAAPANIAGTNGAPAAISVESRSPELEQALAALASQAARELDRPNRAARLAPRPRGLQAESVAPREPGTPAHARSLMPMDEAIAALRELPAPPIPSEAERPDAESREDALRLYARARGAMLTGDVEAAIADLRAATRLDPFAHEPHRELAEAALRSGQQTLGVASMRRAVELGSRDARLLIQLARIETQQGRTDWAATLYVAALEAEAKADDAGVEVLARTGLGEALLELGYDRAGATALSAALDLPPPITLRASAVAGAIPELTRRLPDLWRDVGDAFARAGEDDRALSAYEQAGAFPDALDAGALEPRLLHALMRLGRPSAASIALIEAIERDGGVVGPARAEAARTLAEHGAPRQDLARALSALRASAPHAPSLRKGLALVEAAVLTEREGANVLDRALDERPNAHELLRARLALEHRPESRVQTAVRRVRLAPDSARAVAGALLDAEPVAAPMLERLEQEARRPEGAILLAYVRAHLGEGPGAYEPIAGLRPTASLQAAHDLAIVELAPLAARRDAASAAAERLEHDRTPEGRARTVRALESLGETEAALREARALVEDVGVLHPSIDPALYTELAVNADRADLARAFLGRLLDQDPAHEPAHRARLTLHAPGGPDADAARLADALRALRERLPSSPTARLLGSRDLLERGLFVQADRALRELVELDGMLEALSMLEQLWNRAASAGDHEALLEAEAWVRAQLETRPESPSLSTALARLLLWTGRAEEADAFLSEQIARRPNPALRRAHESIVRDALGDPQRAGELALARLHVGPQTPSATLERAVLLAQLGRLDEMAEALESLESDGAYSAQAGEAVLAAIEAAMQSLERAQRERRPFSASELRFARSAFDASDAVGLTLPRHHHQNRVAVEIWFDPPDAARLERAAANASEAYPDLRHELYITITARLAGADMIDEAIELAERVGASHPLIAGQALLQAGVQAQQRAEALASEPPEARRLVHAGELRLLLRAVQHLHHRSGDPSLVQQSARLLFLRVAQVGETHEAIDATRLLISTGLDSSVLVINPREAMSREQREGETLYQIAVVGYSFGREAFAEQLYRALLEIDPRHAMAMNNLAYALAVRAESLEEAERLAERADAIEPDNMHIIDTLGWIRYKLGVIADEPPREDGSPGRAGAVTLLRRAAALSGDEPDGIVAEQLADALWVAGEREEAVRFWTLAQQAYQRELRTIPRQGNERMARETRQRAERTIAKLRAAERGEPVPVSPTPAWTP